MKINTHEDFNNAILNYNIPNEILLDVKNRIGDWTSSGGSLDDPYIKQQWKYIENYINQKKASKRMIPLTLNLSLVLILMILNT